MILRVVLCVALFVLAIFNGIYSPQTFLVFALQGIWYPHFLPSPLTLMFVLSGIISSVLHLMVTGVPVAMLEKVLPNVTQSALVWLGVMLLPTLLTFKHLGLV